MRSPASSIWNCPSPPGILIATALRKWQPHLACAWVRSEKSREIFPCTRKRRLPNSSSLSARAEVVLPQCRTNATPSRVPSFLRRRSVFLRLVCTLLSAMVQEEERGLGGWHAEWETLPELVCLVGGALHHLTEMLPGLEVDQVRMRENLEVTRGLIFAEAISMALGDRMGKMPAHILVEAACKKARAEKRHLKDILREDPGWHGHLSPADLESLFDVRNYLGSAGDFTTRVLSEVANFSAHR